VARQVLSDLVGHERAEGCSVSPSNRQSMQKAMGCPSRPEAAPCCRTGVSHSSYKEGVHQRLIRAGIDLTKNVFRVDDVELAEEPMRRKKLSRTDTLKALGERINPNCEIGMAVWGSAHDLAPMMIKGTDCQPNQATAECRCERFDKESCLTTIARYAVMVNRSNQRWENPKMSRQKDPKRE
jgi:hypothetical protein